MLRLRVYKTNGLYFLSFLMLSAFILVCINVFNTEQITESHLSLLSYATTGLFLLSLFFLAKIEGRWFGLSSILLLMAFLFNFGQFFLWTFGIHTVTEIGKTNLFANFPVPTSYQIYKAGLFSVYCYIAMVLGIYAVNVFSMKPEYSERLSLRQESIRRTIYRVSVVLSFVIVPATFYKSWLVFAHSIHEGYVSLYYSDFSINSLVNRSEDYFFPVIVGLLLGSQYKKVRIAYLLFGIYMLLYTFAGERGNWFYKLIVLIWMHHQYYRPINWKRFLQLGLLGGIGLTILSVIVSLRHIGIANISWEQIRIAFSTSENILVRFIQEMGGSLGVTIIVLAYGQAPFAGLGNTFVSSALTSFSSALATSLGIQHVYLGNFLSQKLLKINWGTGFTLFGESFVNGGWFGFIYMFFLGILFGSLLKKDTSVLKQYSSCIACVIVSAMMRDSALTGFRQLTQVLLFLLAIIWFLEKAQRKPSYTIAHQ